VKVKALNVETPAVAATVVVPLTFAGVELMTTAAVEVVTTFPKASSTVAAVGANGATLPPRALVAGGCVVNTSLAAGPGVIVTEPLVALVSPALAPVKVYVPTVVKIRLLKVALPLTAETVVVPPTLFVGAEVMAIEAVELVTTFPSASSTDITEAVRGLPAMPLAGGCVVKTS